MYIFVNKKVHLLHKGDIMATFSERLKELRKEKQLTQQKLADDLGVNRVNITRWEKGNIEPNLETLSLIASYFNVSTDYLIGIEDNPPIDHLKELDSKSIEIYELIEKFYNEIEPRIYNVLEKLNNQEIKCEDISEVLNKIIFVSRRRYNIDIQPLVETMINRWIDSKENKKHLLELVRAGKY